MRAPTRKCRERPARAVRQGVVVPIVAAGLLASACSGGNSGADLAGKTTTTTVATTTTTAPSATEDEAAAFAQVEELVLEATSLADRLFQDPSVIEDPDNEGLAQLRELYTDDSPTPEGVEAQLRDLADEEQRLRPAESGVFRDLGVYNLAAVDEDTVRFRVCALEDRQRVNSAGDVVEEIARVVQGDGEARRVEGEWRFFGVNPDEDASREISPGTGARGFCDAVNEAAEEAQ